MKSLILITLCSLSLFAQAGSDPVVVTIDGKDWTKSAFDALVRGLPPELKRGYEVNKKSWLEQYALMTRLAAQAKKEGVDQKEPYRQQIEYNNLMFLAQALLDTKTNAPVTSSADVKNWFDSHKNQYKRARVRGIVVSWGQIPTAGEKSRTDVEAAAIVNDVVKRAKAGESFEELAKKYSDDAGTKDKGGEFPPIRPEDPGINSTIKGAIFILHPGEISQTVRLPGGFYVFKLESFVDATMQELNDEIIVQLGREQSTMWIEKIRQDTKVEIKDPAFFGLAAKK